MQQLRDFEKLESRAGGIAINLVSVHCERAILLPSRHDLQFGARPPKDLSLFGLQTARLKAQSSAHNRHPLQYDTCQLSASGSDEKKSGRLLLIKMLKKKKIKIIGELKRWQARAGII